MKVCLKVLTPEPSELILDLFNYTFSALSHVSSVGIAMGYGLYDRSSISSRDKGLISTP
jgi:hypothetical protein